MAFRMPRYKYRQRPSFRFRSRHRGINARRTLFSGMRRGYNRKQNAGTDSFSFSSNRRNRGSGREDRTITTQMESATLTIQRGDRQATLDIGIDGLNAVPLANRYKSMRLKHAKIVIDFSTDQGGNSYQVTLAKSVRQFSNTDVGLEIRNQPGAQTKLISPTDFGSATATPDGTGAWNGSNPMADAMKCGVAYPKLDIQNNALVGSAASNWVLGTAEGLTNSDWVGVQVEAHMYRGMLNPTVVTATNSLQCHYYWVLTFDCQGRYT